MGIVLIGGSLPRYLSNAIPYNHDNVEFLHVILPRKCPRLRGDQFLEGENLMSEARGFSQNGAKYFTNVTKPMDVNLKFTVTSTNGLGITSLKSNGFVESVFMHTSTTPGSVNGVTNPNPAAGYALITFKNNFNYFLGSFSGQVAPTTSNSTSSVVAGSVYVITALGTTTLAQWLAKGLPPGFTPAVGQAFVAIATGAIGGTGTVGIPAAPSAFNLSVIGNPDTLLNNLQISKNAGAKLLVQFSTESATSGALTLTMNSYTPAGTNDGGTPPIFTGTPAVLTGTVSTPAITSSLTVGSPSDGSVVSMMFRFDGSSVTIDGI